MNQRRTRPMKIRIEITIIGGATMLALAFGCPATESPEPSVGITDVAMRNTAFDPQEITIGVGGRVRWTNFDLVTHTATSGDPGDENAGDLWDSDFLGRGESFTSEPFETPGEFVYFCRIHPLTMRGAKVIVSESAPDQD